MKEYLEIIRPLNCFMATVAVFIGVLVSGFYSPSPVILGGISVFLTCAGGMVINDYIDREIDEMDKPERPIPSGRISPQSALVYTFVLFAGGIVFSWFINYQVFLLSIFSTLILVLYSKYLQRMFLIGNLTVSFMVGLAFVYGGLISGSAFSTILMAIIAFFSNTAREIIKDVEDREGDSTIGIKSAAIVLGEWGSKILAIFFVICAIAITPVPYLIGLFGFHYLILISVSNGISIYTIIMILKNGKDNKIQRLMKTGMIFGLVAFLIGAL